MYKLSMRALNKLFLSSKLHATSLMKPVIHFGDRGNTVVKVLRYKNRKVAGSIPDGVIGIFH